MDDNQTASLFGPTPWQTVGPFFHYSLPWIGCADLVGEAPIGARPELSDAPHQRLHRPPPRGLAGEPIILAGRVLDAQRAGVDDALIETWQADGAGHYDHGGFRGFGRCATAAGGSFEIRTVKPGPVAGAAPYITLGILGRGILRRLTTRIYFEDEPLNAGDPVLTAVPPERRGTLIAHRRDGVYAFDIILQGEGETVFFQC